MRDIKLQLSIGNVYTHVSDAGFRELGILYEGLSYIVKNHEMAARQTGTNWNGKKSYFENKISRFLTGFLNRVLEILDVNEIEYKIKDTRNIPVIKEAGFNLHEIVPRDYQEKSINDFIRAGRGIAKLATGAGKTEVSMCVTKHLSVKTLFLTHRVNLLRQTARRFQEKLPEIKSEIGIIGDGVYNPKQITIATVQSIDAVETRYKKMLKAKRETSKKKLSKQIDELNGKKSLSKTDKSRLRNY